MKNNEVLLEQFLFKVVRDIIHGEGGELAQATIKKHFVKIEKINGWDK